MNNRFTPIPVLSTKEHVMYVANNILDDFAKEKGYDSITSACSYSTSNIEKFKNEAQRAIAIRDTIWSDIMSKLSDPSNAAIDILAALPKPTWD